jgi:hypothetical protein
MRKDPVEAVGGLEPARSKRGSLSVPCAAGSLSTASAVARGSRASHSRAIAARPQKSSRSASARPWCTARRNAATLAGD